MIDTDKYEGHTPADEWESHLIDALFETEFPMTYADNQLMADAPLLLEEVKRLRDGIQFWFDTFSHDEDDVMVRYFKRLIE